MKIEFDDGSFLQVEKQDRGLVIIQCAKKDRKVSMSSVRLTQEQTQQLLNFLSSCVERK